MAALRCFSWWQFKDDSSQNEVARRLVMAVSKLHCSLMLGSVELARKLGCRASHESSMAPQGQQHSGVAAMAYLHGDVCNSCTARQQCQPAVLAAAAAEGLTMPSRVRRW